ncbi:MAG TPA: hypothetical protein VHT70_02975 [Candidatus Saccharimonadales bacterium]|jgi:hypothetical protein|nr:hypothetical protein [Candidatus Saccharimonadales bacterium]
MQEFHPEQPEQPRLPEQPAALSRSDLESARIYEITEPAEQSTPADSMLTASASDESDTAPSYPARLADFVVPFDGRQPAVTEEEKALVGASFESLITDLLADDPEDVSYDFKHAKEEVWFKLPIEGSSDRIAIAVSSDKVRYPRSQDPIPEARQEILGVKEIAIAERFGEGGLQGDTVAYRLFPDGVVRRYDFRDANAAFKLQKETGAIPHVTMEEFAELPPEQQLAYVDIVKNQVGSTLKAMMFEREMGTNVQPISQEEFESLKKLITQPGVEHAPWFSS